MSEISINKQSYILKWYRQVTFFVVSVYNQTLLLNIFDAYVSICITERNGYSQDRLRIQNANIFTYLIEYSYLHQSLIAYVKLIS